MADSVSRPILMMGDKVGLALMRPEDVPVIAWWHQDLDFTARLATPGEAHTVEVRAELYGQNSRVKGDSAEFAVVDMNDGRLVGIAGLFDITRARIATMFVAIGDPDDRGQGFGSEASRLVCEYGFFFRSLYGIKVEVHGYNRAAIGIYEKLGFKTAGRLRGANLLNGQRYDEVIMDLLRDELEFKHVAQFASLTE